MPENLTQMTLRGLKWSYLSTILIALLQIIFTAVMARLLEPSAFGLVAMANVFLRFGSYFANMGMGQAIIQKEKLEEENIVAAFSFSFVLGLTFFGIFCFLAPFAATIFHSPKIVTLTRVLSLSFLFTGLSTTANSILRRKLDFKSLAYLESISFIVSYGIIGIFMAVRGYEEWSLVAASLSQAFFSALMSYLIVRHPLSLFWDIAQIKKLGAYGGRISIISFFEFIGSSLDIFFIGRSLGAEKLGLYNRGQMLVNLPMQYFTNSFSRVLFPSFSKIQAQVEKLKESYLMGLGILAFFILPGCIGISIAAEPIIRVVLGEKWLPAVPVLRLLALATPFNMLSHLGGILCDSTGRLDDKLLLTIIYILFLGCGLVIFSKQGLEAVAALIVCSEILRHIAYLNIISRILQCPLREIYQVYKPAVVASGLVGLLLFIVIFLGRTWDVSIYFQFILAILTGLLSLYLVLLIKSNENIKLFLFDKIKIGLYLR